MRRLVPALVSIVMVGSILLALDGTALAQAPLKERLAELERRVTAIEQFLTRVSWEITVEEVGQYEEDGECGERDVLKVQVMLNGIPLLPEEEWFFCKDDGERAWRRGVWKHRRVNPPDEERLSAEFEFSPDDTMAVELWGKGSRWREGGYELVARWEVTDPRELENLWGDCEAHVACVVERFERWEH